MEDEAIKEAGFPACRLIRRSSKQQLTSPSISRIRIFSRPYSQNLQQINMSTTITSTIGSSSASRNPDVISTSLSYSVLPANGEKPYTRTYTPEDPSVPKTNLTANEIPVDVRAPLVHYFS